MLIAVTRQIWSDREEEEEKFISHEEIKLDPWDSVPTLARSTSPFGGGNYYLWSKTSLYENDLAPS
jgi:hypothetical protein